IYDAYQVINRFQMNNWSCHVKCKIMTDGTLVYRVRFYKQNMECEIIATTMPMAICKTAMAIINDEYVEFVDKEDEDDLSIYKKMPQIGIEKIDFSDETFLELLEKTVKETGEENLAEKIIDILSKNGYFIVREKPEDF
ncbi:hypothetical protein LCGC14_2821250, partial [marine sediment metagenome]